MADSREVLLFSKHHQDGILESMHQLRLQGHLCDVTVQVDYQGSLEEFEVHQVVLAASCGYFRDILLVKDSPSKLFISNMHSSDFSTVLTFAYTGKAGVIKEKISEIRQAAILLDFKELVDSCSKAMNGESPFEWVNETKSPLDTADDVVGIKKASKARTKKPPKQVMRKRKLNPVRSEKEEGRPKQAKVDDAADGEKEAPPEEAGGGRRLSSRLAGRKVFTGIMRKHMRPMKEPSKASDKTADSQEGREKTQGEAGAELESEAGKAEEGGDVSMESALESDDGEAEEELPVDDRKDPLYLTLEEEREGAEQAKRASRRSEAQFTCEKCQRTFHYERSYLKHISTYHGVTTDITYRCETCQQTFANRGNLKIHEKHVHNDERMYSCEVCTKTFKRKKDVLRHQRQVHEGGGPRHICPECGKALSSKTALLLHERTHTGAKPFDCTDCGAKFSQSSALKMHRRIHTGEKPFACDVCDARFTQKHMLAYHKRSHTGEKPFMCEACGKSFASKEYLRHHSNIHTGSRPYKCKQCGRGFAQRNSLHQHIKIHTGERPYCCKDCDKQFTQLNALQRHQRIHTGEKPYMCGLCNRTFTDKSTVRRHTLTHDTDAPWKNYLVVLKGNVEGKKPKPSPKVKAEKSAAGEKSRQAGGESNPEAGTVVTEPITLAGDWAGAGTIALVSHTTLGGFTLIQAEVPAGSQIQNPIIATDSTGTSIISLDGTAISVPFSIPMSLAAHSIPVSSPSPSPVTVSEAELTSVSETATISTSSVLETVVSQTILAPLSMEEEPVPEAAMLDPDIHTVVVGEGVGSGLSPKLDGVGEQTLTALADEEPSIAEVTCTGETEVSTEGAV